MDPDRLVALIARFEGFVPWPYDDKGRWLKNWPHRERVSRSACRRVGSQYKMIGKDGTVTVAFGETDAGFVDRYWERDCPRSEGMAQLLPRAKWFYDGVRRCIDAPLTAHQWEAVACRSYQTGVAGFCRSQTAKHLKARDYKRALAAWVAEFAHPDRSEVEVAHFLTPDADAPVDSWEPFVAVLV